jgi:hypothetical protein
MKECTFQPNKDLKQVNPKEVRDTINNLYTDGVNKLRSRKTTAVKEPEPISMECTFHPRINEL